MDSIFVKEKPKTRLERKEESWTEKEEVEIDDETVIPEVLFDGTEVEIVDFSWLRREWLIFEKPETVFVNMDMTICTDVPAVVLISVWEILLMASVEEEEEESEIPVIEPKREAKTWM